MALHDIYDLCFINCDVGFAVGDYIYKTTDGGTSWLKKTDIDDIIKSIVHIPPSSFYACSIGGLLYSSSDNGETWSTKTKNKTFTSLTINNSNILFAAGTNGVLLSTNPPITTEVKLSDKSSPNNFILYQNYPNPFNPSTTIKYSIPKRVNSQSSIVNLKVYDVLGREITTLINKELAPGNYEVEFNASSLASGVYFYRLEAGSFIQTKKMILLR
ncbi:MAG: T9SS type A sorting domain-containing protein [Ignavibacteriaceae bacterium]|nr:T9SS type A sorting domain-containing protein [Ignavibacteriaceae bacterium]